VTIQSNDEETNAARSRRFLKEVAGDNLAYSKLMIILGNVDYCNTHDPIIRTLLSQRVLYLSDLLKKLWNRDIKLYRFHIQYFFIGAMFNNFEI